MGGRSAVLFLLDDRCRTGSETPLMLHRVTGVPLLKWLSESLFRAEVSRFFLACDPALRAAAETCFPEGAAVTAASDENLSDLLHVFLSTAEEKEESVLVVTGPAVYLPFHRGEIAQTRSNACMVGREELMKALDETAPIGRFIQQEGEACTGEDGFYSVSAPEDLDRWQPLLITDYLQLLRRNGVEIWDSRSTYVEPGIDVGIGTVLLPGTILQGRTSVGYGCTIGPNTRIIDSNIGNHCVVEQSRLEQVRLTGSCQVGPFANLRPGTVLDQKTKAGAFVELKNTNLYQGAQVPHLSYLGDATVGAGTNIGCGAVTANFDRVQKHPTVIGREAFVGCNTTLVAPVTVGEGAYVGAGSVITEDIPAQALAIGRSRQQNKREWALRNKKEEEE